MPKRQSSACAFLWLLVMCSDAYAEYPGFSSGSICNGYPESVGRITKVAATTAYKSTQGVYVNLLTDIGGQNVGGVIYWRSTQEWAYNHMVRMAMFLQAVGAKAKVCHHGDYIYAIEMQ